MPMINGRYWAPVDMQASLARQEQYNAEQLWFAVTTRYGTGYYPTERLARAAADEHATPDRPATITPPPGLAERASCYKLTNGTDTALCRTEHDAVAANKRWFNGAWKILPPDGWPMPNAARLDSPGDRQPDRGVSGALKYWAGINSMETGRAVHAIIADTYGKHQTAENRTLLD